MHLIYCVRRCLAVKVNFNTALPVTTGVLEVARAVAVTLGPRGNNVLIEQDSDGKPLATKDGVTVAKNVMLADPDAEQIASLCRSSANEANKSSGDGTTTTTILTAQLVIRGLAALQNGLSIRALKEGFDLFEREACQFLRLKAVPITKPYQYSQVAGIATNGDKEIGALAVNACMKSQFSTSVKIQESKGPNSQLVIDNCISLVRSPDPRFFTEQQRITLEYPAVLLLQQKLQSMKLVADLLGQLKGSRKTLLIFAPDYSKQVVDSLYFNHSRNIVKICPISLQGENEFIQQQLLDFSIAFKTKVFREAQLPYILPHELGDARAVTTDKIQTKIYAGSDNLALQQHVAALKKRPQTALLKERLDRLVTNRVTVMVGAQNQLLFKEKRDKVIDAINAICRAKRSGVLPGGGVALLRLSPLLQIMEFSDDRVKDVLKESLQTPFLMLCHNEVSSIVRKRVQNGQFCEGVDLRTGQVCDLVARGVMEGCSTVTNNLRSALRSAYGILSIQVIITKSSRDSLPSYREFKGKYQL